MIKSIDEYFKKLDKIQNLSGELWAIEIVSDLKSETKDFETNNFDAIYAICNK